MNPSNLSLRQKSRGTVVKTIAIHLYGARDPNYIVDLTLSNLLWTPPTWERLSVPDPHVTPARKIVGTPARFGMVQSDCRISLYQAIVTFKLTCDGYPNPAPWARHNAQFADHALVLKCACA